MSTVALPFARRPVESPLRTGFIASPCTTACHSDPWRHRSRTGPHLALSRLRRDGWQGGVRNHDPGRRLPHEVAAGQANRTSGLVGAMR